uniref:Uncharacterized protein n=1 Tax=Anguilla anguilla TaxID=7936 RepID=A0A0E9QCN3_ANGAN
MHYKGQRKFTKQSCTHFISDRISICGYTEQVFCNKLRNHAQLYSLNLTQCHFIHLGFHQRLVCHVLKPRPF